MNNLIRDLRYALRLLLRQPLITIVIILTLALGIGANTAIFTVVNAALLRPLPYREPDQLVHLWETKPQRINPEREASYPDFLDWQQNDVFAGMAAYTGFGSATLTARENRDVVQMGVVTANFFDVLSVDPLLGRTFRAGEDEPGSERAAVITHGLWQRLYGADPGAIGQTIEINESPVRIVGVLPAGFHFARRGAAEIWLTWRPTEAQRTRRYMHWVNVIARLKPDVTRSEAEAAMGLIASRIAEAHPDSHAGTGIRLAPLKEQFVGGLRDLLVALLAAVGVVLLIACANIANLLSARAAAREREIAIRSALGATRGRLVRQLLVESLLLSLAGGALGLLIAVWGIDALIAAIPESRLAVMPFLRDPALDLRIFIFTGGLSILTGILFGLAPALGSTRGALDEVLRGGTRAAGTPRQKRLGDALVVAEIALSFVLLVGAGLLVQSLTRLLAVDPGFDPRNLLTMQVGLPPAKYDTPEKVNAFHDELKARLAAMPGVRGAATVDVLPLVGGNTTKFFLLGEGEQRSDESPEVNIRGISDDYFRVMGVKLLSGREFAPSDTVNTPQVVIINRTLADRLLAGRDPVGRRIVFSGNDRTPYEIVGVVGDERVNGIDAPVPPVVYYASRQDLNRFTGLVVRTEGESRALAETIRRAAFALEPRLSIYNVATVEEMIADAPGTFARRYPALLVGVFAVIALALSTIGIYGLISYRVSQQRRELGVRLALGATKKDILRMVMRRGLILAGGGIGLGIAASLAVTRLLGSLLFGISPTDPLTLGALALLLGAVAAITSYLPARRAARVDPLLALRYE